MWFGPVQQIHYFRPTGSDIVDSLGMDFQPRDFCRDVDSFDEEALICVGLLDL